MYNDHKNDCGCILCLLDSLTLEELSLIFGGDCEVECDCDCEDGCDYVEEIEFEEHEEECDCGHAKCQAINYYRDELHNSENDDDFTDNLVRLYEEAYNDGYKKALLDRVEQDLNLFDELSE